MFNDMFDKIPSEEPLTPTQQSDLNSFCTNINKFRDDLQSAKILEVVKAVVTPEAFAAIEEEIKYVGGTIGLAITKDVPDEHYRDQDNNMLEMYCNQYLNKYGSHYKKVST
jgi:phage terminase small subunit